MQTTTQHEQGKPIGICVIVGDELVTVRFEEIIYVQSDDNYCRIYSAVKPSPVLSFAGRLGYTISCLRFVLYLRVMHDALIAYISRYSTTPMTAEDMAMIREIFIPKKLRKRQYFLQEGKVCRHMAFLVKGAMRQYTVDDKGTEHIVRLSLEEWWVGDRDSAVNLTPSPYNIDAWEDSELLTVTSADMVQLRKIPAITELSQWLDNKHAFALQKRISAAISLPAEQRYADLVKTYPQFLERFPQHIIASYLGITKETLSRIRRNALYH